MRTTIDRAGRIVIPKALRQALGVDGGAEVEIGLNGDRIEIEVPPTPMRLERHEHGAVAVTDRHMPKLTTEMVRQTLEGVRR